MNKIVFVFAIIAIVAVYADPKPKPGLVGAYAAAPLIAPAVVTAQSSQIIAQNYNGFAAPYVASPYVSAPYVASPYIASSYASSPYLASPYAASPYVASPYVASRYAASPYVASPYVASPYVASPYVAAPGVIGRSAAVIAAPTRAVVV